MNLFHAIVLGIVQGLTEFIPISSSGHLIITSKLLGLDQTLSPEQLTAFIAVIQLGTLAAVLIYFARDILEISLGFIEGNLTLLGRGDQRPAQLSEGRRRARLGWLIIIGSLPIATVGLLAKKIIEGTLTKNLYVISVSMIVWAVMLFIAEMVGKRRKDMQDIEYRDALVIGLAQVFALIPGSSRSGTTICGALFSGLKRDVAARFSFLVSIPVIGASGLLELRDAIEHIGAIGMGNLVAATIVSGLVGYASIAFLLYYLRNNSSHIFIMYRLLAGVAILGLLLAKAIQPV
ncbi:MAG: undecaprenyl-diphosphatase UppP [Blastocatellia bacterium]